MTEVPRIFSTFLYSEPFELEILLAKLHSEAPLVERWLAVENAFTFKGEPKPTDLAAQLASDPRFAEFADRITVVSLCEDFSAGYRYGVRARVEHAARMARRRSEQEWLQRAFVERRFFSAEARQRDAVIPALLAVSGGQGWVLAGDVDEMLAVEDPARLDALIEATRSGAGVVALRRRRFVYDVDNEALSRVRSAPLVSVGLLAGRPSLAWFRAHPVGVVPGPRYLLYEYSSCYSRAHIARKYATFSHLDPGSVELDRALECNHVPGRRHTTRIVPEDWYWRVDPEAAGAPRYVLEHLERLRTGAVNPEYAEARRRRYPELFGRRTNP